MAATKKSKSKPISNPISKSRKTSMFDYWTSEKGLAIIQSRFQSGATVAEVCKAIHITRQTFYLWAKKSPRLKEVSLQSREDADAQVECALFKLATGYTRKCKYTDSKGRTKEREIYYPPSEKAIELWLSNRQAKKWNNRRKDSGDDDAKPVINVNVQIADGSSESLEHLDDELKDDGL